MNLMQEKKKEAIGIQEGEKQGQIDRVRRSILAAEVLNEVKRKRGEGNREARGRGYSSQDGKLPVHGLTSWQKGWREMKIFCFISTKWTSK